MELRRVILYGKGNVEVNFLINGTANKDYVIEKLTSEFNELPEAFIKSEVEKLFAWFKNNYELASENSFIVNVEIGENSPSYVANKVKEITEEVLEKFKHFSGIIKDEIDKVNVLRKMLETEVVLWKD